VLALRVFVAPREERLRLLLRVAGDEVLAVEQVRVEFGVDGELLEDLL